MIIVDVETTGTDPRVHSIVSIGAIDFESPKDQFYVECRIWSGAHVEQGALAVNGYNQEALNDPTKPEEGMAIGEFLKWLETRSNVLLAAQNPIFDLGFLQAAAARAHLSLNLGHRTIDLHTIAFAHMTAHGIAPPTKNRKSDINSDGIMAYVGIPTEPKPHIAINGAVWEAEALSRLLFGKNLLPEFSKYPIPWVGGGK